MDDERGRQADAETTVARIANPHARPAEEVLKALSVSAEAGLSENDVRARRAAFGPNKLETRARKSARAILLHQVRSSVVALLAVAAGLSAAMSDWNEAIAIAIVLVLNTLIGFVTELRAERSMEALRALGASVQRVRRHGRTRIVSAEELVPGDIILVEEGDVATADARIVRAANLEVDESALTGESLPVQKSPDPVPKQAPIAEQRSMLFRGTAVTRGHAVAVVTATGMATELGQIARLATAAEPEPSPLTKKIDRLAADLVFVTLAIVTVIAIAGILQGQQVFLMVEAAIALAVAAIPEGLPIVATLALARGMWRMARKNALIERLSAVETLGATTIILTDKTGTLTENRMALVRIATPAGDFLARPGATRLEPRDSGTKGRQALRRLLSTAALCNSARLAAPGMPDYGDPMELALLRAAREEGIERERLLQERPEVSRHAFDSSVKMMATVHSLGEGYLIAVKGAPEAVLAASARIGADEGEAELDASQRDAWTKRAEMLAGEGLRVIGVAERRVRDAGGEPYRELTFLGLVGLQDPPRPDVPRAIAACRRAGIRVVMITGDHAATAASIAASIGLMDGQPKVIEGREIVGPNGNIREEALRADVLARVSPAQKLQVVAAHQAAGAVVAMTGDGVNDAPALKKADIGIAMGQRGTEVARQAAAMVLRDDSFPTIVEAVRQGRIIFENIRRFVAYLLACNLSEIMIVSLAVLAGMPLPLLPLQILFLNLLTDVFPAFALALGQGRANVLDEPPRNPAEPILDQRRWLEIAAYGAAMTAVVLAAMQLALSALGLNPKQAVTVSFLTLLFAQLWHVFNVTEHWTDWPEDIVRNPYVWLAFALCIALTVLAVHLPPLARVLQLTAPDVPTWVLVLGMSFVSLLAGRLTVAAMDRLVPVRARR